MYRKPIYRLRGISFAGHRFRASIRTPDGPRYLGTYDSPYEAALAYDAAACELRGTTAKLNFKPDEPIPTYEPPRPLITPKTTTQPKPAHRPQASQHTAFLPPDCQLNQQDRDLLSHTWRINKAGYLTSSIDGRTVTLHRTVLKRKLGAIPTNYVCDHINGDRLDNRRRNLRAVTRANNARNRRPYIRTGPFQYKGVTQEGKKYRVRITAHGTRYDLGTYTSALQAAAAYDAAAREHFGEHAGLNFAGLTAHDAPDPK